MPKLTIIVGMGGSGKTTHCEKLGKERNCPYFSDATLADGNERRAGHRSLGEIVARLLSGERECVMDEAHLTDSEFRKSFERFLREFLPGVEQEWIFIAKDTLACINNIYLDLQKGKRNDDRCRLQSVRNQIRNYTAPKPGDYPGYQQLHPVHSRPGGKFTSEREALAWLDDKIASYEVPVAPK